nr:bile salt stimulated lipase, BSSL {N-terminal} [Mustela putorius=ferrets, milk, furo, Peptide, 22 aa] [Mustela putorius]
ASLGAVYTEGGFVNHKLGLFGD